MNQSAEHTKLKNEIILALGQRPDVLIWNSPTGVFRGLNNPRIITRVGVKGRPDIECVVGPYGRFLGIEVKTGTGRQSEEQGNFQKALEARGAFYVIVRSVNDAFIAVERVKYLLTQRKL